MDVQEHREDSEAVSKPQDGHLAIDSPEYLKKRQQLIEHLESFRRSEKGAIRFSKDDDFNKIGEDEVRIFDKLRSKTITQAEVDEYRKKYIRTDDPDLVKQNYPREGVDPVFAHLADHVSQRATTVLHLIEMERQESLNDYKYGS